MENLRITHPQPAVIYFDNVSIIKIVSIQVFYGHTKNIEIGYEREKVQQG